MRKLFAAVALTVLFAGPAMAGCGYRSKAGECNSYGNDPDDYSGCSVETSNAWYNIEISSGTISAEKVCEKYPPEGYCSCSDYFIY